MPTTRVFKSGNSQAVRIPSELQFDRTDIDYEIVRDGDEIRIRPAKRRLNKLADKFASFSSRFMAKGRPGDDQSEREAL
jgi:antitoxin VapB